MGKFHISFKALHNIIESLSDTELHEVIAAYATRAPLGSCSYKLVLDSVIKDCPELLKSVIDDRLSCDIMERLHQVDGILTKKNIIVKLDIVGGSALILQGITTRLTKDIDSISQYSKVISSILLPFVINNDARDVSVMSEGYESRVKHLDSFENLQVGLVHPLDIFLMKLQRMSVTDGHDIEDILNNLSDEDKRIAKVEGEKLCDVLSPVFQENFKYYSRYLV